MTGELPSSGQLLAQMKRQGVTTKSLATSRMWKQVCCMFLPMPCHKDGKNLTALTQSMVGLESIYHTSADSETINDGILHSRCE